MKITKTQLKQIIKEELNLVMQEQDSGDMQQVASKMLSAALQLSDTLPRDGYADHAIRGQAFVMPSSQDVYVYVAESVLLSPKGGTRGFKVSKTNPERIAEEIGNVVNHFNFKKAFRNATVLGTADISEFKQSMKDRKGYFFELAITKGTGTNRKVEGFVATQVTPKGLVGGKAKEA